MEVHIVADSNVAQALEVARSAFAELRKIYAPIVSAPVATAAAALTRVVAVEEESVIGTLLFQIKGECLHIRGLGVDPKHRRRGVAKRLIEFVAAEAQAAGLKEMTLYTVKESGNVPIFEHLGFSAAHEEPDPTSRLVTGGTPTDVFMIRPVSSAARL